MDEASRPIAAQDNLMEPVSTLAGFGADAAHGHANPIATTPPAARATTLTQGLRRMAHFGMVAAGVAGLTDGRAWSGPLNAQIGISDPCNHRCVMCWDHPPAERENELTSPQARFGRRKPRLMPLAMFKDLVDDLYELGNRRVEMVGRGEPLMNPSALDMVAHAKSRDVYVQMISNGALIDATVARAFVNYGLDNLKVSLNAGRASTYPRIHVTESEENYLRVKSNLRHVADLKHAAGVALPLITLSFCIGARNYSELEDMIGVAHEVGAQEVLFNHTVVHDDTQDLKLTPDQYLEMREIALLAERLADQYGIQNNLAFLRADVPTYLETEIAGSSVVPCYAGYYFAFVLGNGSVMFCCQCSESVDQIADGRRFRDIWNDHTYRRFRKAARALPQPDPLLHTCECDRCALRPRNVSIHNLVRPLSRIACGDEVKKFSIADVGRKWHGMTK